MKVKELNRYRISTPKRYGTYVVASSPLLAVKVLFPEAETTIHKTGKGWIQVNLSHTIPYGWPNQLDIFKNKSDEDFGNIVDIEDHGKVLVVEDNEDEE